ncbi:V-type ATPase 116kDa subunit family protein [Lentzea nigeriaca]|uniref:V-type ATPase 116kDa subunit family protein n=1 Tax=Lentzea nigeriaca TaxID=1128665 RepID=UPI001958DA9F|nr:V-type ATPase 116kDa subunit family protein [Lentzea nigeriaca]MBM7863726.1 V/A-type H+-transporting ATPase subunit I [Lentzea nigeriaca]
MPLPEAVTPVRMERVAIVAPGDVLRDAVLKLSGLVDIDRTEEELEKLIAGAVRRGEVAALAGWCPADDRPGIAAALAEVGAAIVPMRAPRGVDPPTLLRETGSVRRSFTPLVSTYGTVPYQDVDPTLLAGAAYVLMFGMMFGDAGQGLLLVAVAALLRGWSRLARWRAAWPFVAGAGVASTLFGVLYGEFFGPTGVVAALWVDPLEDPVLLLGSGVAVGAVLLAAAYAVAIVNRWREGGPRLAVYAASGVAGAALFLGIAGVAGGLLLHAGLVVVAGAVTAVAGLTLAGVGFAAASGGGAAGVAQAVVELFDIVIRTGSNLVSFARLAAFGLVHAAIGSLVWLGTTALAGHGVAGVGAAVVLFLLGNALAFSLEALVAAIQALRLEFYELFSRVFEIEGRPFRPWHGEAR